MRRGQFRYTVPRSVIEPTQYGSRMTQAGFLDMMRYDAARVESWDSETITLVSERYTAERWHSMGIYPTLKSDMVGV
jgi:hypothetical protein